MRRDKSMEVLKEKLAKHPRREIPGRSWNGTPCLELMNRDGKKPVKLNPNGYARVRDGQGGMVFAHRAALAIETERDCWTEPLVTDHRCHQRNCINAMHLRWVTNKENVAPEAMSVEGAEVRRANGRSAVTSGQLASVRGRGIIAGGRATAEKTRVEIVSLNLITGERKWWRGQTDAARELRLNGGNISQCVRDRLRRTGAYRFERFDPNNPTHAALTKDRT